MQHLGDEAMAPHSFRQGQATGHEHAWPVHRMKAQNVFAYDVVGWPAMLLQVLCCGLQTIRKQACNAVQLMLSVLQQHGDNLLQHASLQTYELS